MRSPPQSTSPLAASKSRETVYNLADLISLKYKAKMGKDVAGPKSKNSQTQVF
jgi:hypothetical protein